MRDIVLCIQFKLEMYGFAYKLIDAERFRVICFTLDNIMKKCTEEGLGNTTRQADIISFADEDRMWIMGILGTE